MLWKWCLRRHPNKGKPWVAKKYFGQHGNAHWRFQANDGKKTIYLFDVSSVKIERHIMVKGAASPDDPALREYWQTRTSTRKARSRLRKVTKALKTTGSEARAGCDLETVMSGSWRGWGWRHSHAHSAVDIGPGTRQLNLRLAEVESARRKRLK
jgi:RNA-directed DNA polymerase